MPVLLAKVHSIQCLFGFWPERRLTRYTFDRGQNGGGSRKKSEQSKKICINLHKLGIRYAVLCKFMQI